jgi:ferritin
MLSEPIQKAFNDQIQCELYSAYLYLAMAAHFESAALPGCAKWMHMQANEEVAHAMRLFKFINDRGGRVVLQAIDAPPSDFGSPRDAFQNALEHERHVTARIHQLNELAAKENDYAAQSHLQWFIDEQVEEEKSAQDIVDLFDRARDHEAAIIFIDSKLAQRGEAAG